MAVEGGGRGRAGPTGPIAGAGPGPSAGPRRPHGRPRTSAPPGLARAGGIRRCRSADRQDDPLGRGSAVPVRRRARRTVPVRAAPGLVSAADHHCGDQLRRAGSAGGELPHAVRRARSPRRLLRARGDPRNRSVDHRDRRRRRRRHGDHRRPRRAQGARGARRAAGARRRPGQEPRRAALSGADGRDRPVRHLLTAVRHLRRHRRRARQRPAARAVLGHAVRQRLDDRPVGLGSEDHLLRRDHRDRLLLQGHDRIRRRRGRWARGQ